MAERNFRRGSQIRVITAQLGWKGDAEGELSLEKDPQQP